MNYKKASFRGQHSSHHLWWWLLTDNSADKVLFDPCRTDIRFFAGDTKDWALYDNYCFGVSTADKTRIGLAPNKDQGVILGKEGYEMSREEFSKMYPELGI